MFDARCSDYTMTHAFLVIAFWAVVFFCSFRFFTKIAELLSRLDSKTRQSDEARYLMLVTTSAHQGLAAIWLCCMFVISMFVLVGLCQMILKIWPVFCSAAGLGT